MTDTALLPFIPMVLAAYEDGHLTPEDILRVRDAATRSSWLSDDAKKTLNGWLDPEAPLRVRELTVLKRELREAMAKLPPEHKQTLRDLGVSLVPASSPELTQLPGILDEIAFALGTPVASFNVRPAAAAPAPVPFDVAALQALLDGPHAEARKRVREMLTDPEFRFVAPNDTHAYRERVLHWTRLTAQHGLSDMRTPEFIAVFETLASFDLSLVVKFGVQFGLFGGAIFNLGTKAHHALLPKVFSLELPGCFAMTERGHGSNVRDLQTLASYEDGAFTITTPKLSAGKEWIGNAALHARMAVVFAQLQTQGEAYGVHAFLVPIRDDEGNVLPGVRVEDCGAKMGLNGVDNGRLYFDHVRVPRESLLDRFGHVEEDGTYDSAINDGDKRFFTMLGTLVAGRVSVAGAGVTAAKVGLSIAIRYGSERRQFEDGTGEERVLLDYLTHQRRLMPRLAAAYAFSFSQEELVARYIAAQKEEPGSLARRALEGLAAGLKALGTWNTRDTLQLCREACGGQGYLTANRIHALRADTDVFTTFEGDNTVLLQLVAKDVLAQFNKQFGEDRLGTVLRMLAKDVSSAVVDRNPITKRSEGEEHLRDFSMHLRALSFRERSLTTSLGRRIAKRVQAGAAGVDAFNACQDHALALGRAHVEHFVVERFQAAVSRVDGEAQARLSDLCALFALQLIENDLAWFLENDYFEAAKARAIRKQVTTLCAEIRPHALALCDAFALPSSSLGPLADADFIRQSGL